MIIFVSKNCPKVSTNSLAWFIVSVDLAWIGRTLSSHNYSVRRNRTRTRRQYNDSTTQLLRSGMQHGVWPRVPIVLVISVMKVIGFASELLKCSHCNANLMQFSPNILIQTPIGSDRRNIRTLYLCIVYFLNATFLAEKLICHFNCWRNNKLPIWRG